MRADRTARRHAARGFTLIEVLVALALVTGMTIALYSALAPYFAAKQKQDTEVRLAEISSALQTAYREHAMQVDSQSSTSATFAVGADPTNPILSSAIQTTGTTSTCAENVQAEQLLTPYLANSPVRGLRDGYQRYFCFFVSKPLSKTLEGVTIWYHVIAVVSTGRDGRLDSGAGMPFDATTGTLALAAAGDDMGITVTGYPIQTALYQETSNRLNRVATLYGAYFTARFQGNPARDYSIDYFAGCTDATNTCSPLDYDTTATLVAPTAGVWVTVATALAPALGLGPQELASAWTQGADQVFEVANQKLASASDLVDNVQVQDPDTKTVNLPPYTALLRTALPTPSDQPTVYSLKVVPGTY